MDASNSTTCSSRRADRRTRELYRYFQPSRQSAFKSADIDDSPPVSLSTSILDTDSASSSPPDIIVPHVFDDDIAVLGSHSPTLTSFAQLAALRLNAQRAMIWFVACPQSFISHFSFLYIYVISG